MGLPLIYFQERASRSFGFLMPFSALANHSIVMDHFIGQVGGLFLRPSFDLVITSMRLANCWLGTLVGLGSVISVYHISYLLSFSLHEKRMLLYIQIFNFIHNKYFSLIRLAYHLGDIIILHNCTGVFFLRRED